MSDPVRLVVIRNPFDRRERDEHRIAVSSAPTIEALVGEYIPAGTADGTDMVVVVNGALIDRADWSRRTIDAGDEMIAMPVIHGGGGGGLLGTIASIALMVVAPGIGASIYTALGGTFVSAYAGLMVSALTVGVSLLGSAIIGSLTAPDKPQLPSRSLQSYDASPSYGWNPTTTQEPGGVVNRAYGRVKLYGNIIAGYIENTGDTGREQIAHALVDLGMGPYSRLYDFRINQQGIDNYRGVTLIERRGNLNQEVIGDFSDTRLTRPIGAKVVKDSPITRTMVGSDFDALDILLTFPQGLYYANDSGGLDSRSVDLRVEISEDGATWRSITSKVINRPQTVVQVRWSIGYYTTQYPWGFEYPQEVWVETSNGGSNPASYTSGQWLGGGLLARWIVQSLVVSVSDTVDYITVTGAQQQPIRKTLRVDNLTRGITYQVRVTNLTEDQTSNRYGDDLYLSEINEVLYDDFTYPRTVLAGIRALATDQLSGGLQFDCMADAAIVRVWNGSAWASEFSRNPAWICWDILTQPVLDNDLAVVRYDGLDPARLILADFYAWAQWCDGDVPGPIGMEPRCQFDGTFDTPTSAWEAALEVAASARATLLMRGTSVSVVWDRPRAMPAQVFSAGNTAVNSFREIFLPMQDRAGAIEVDYVNAEQDHQRDKLTVVNAAITEASAQRVQFSNRGIRRPSQAWREAMFKLKRNELLRRSGELGVDIDAIACTVGDLIWVQNDVTRWGEGGRIVSGNVSQINLDKSITLAPGKAYEAVIRLADDTIASRPISTGPGTWAAITLASPLPFVPTPYDVWAIGESGRAIKPFIVTDIRRDNDQRATLSLIEYNASLYLVDSGAATVPTPDLSYQPNAAITSLSLTEGMMRADDGSVVVYIDVTVTATPDCRAVRISAPGWAQEEVITGQRRLMGAVSGETYTITASPVDALGRLQPQATWESASITLVGKLAPPADVPWFLIRGQQLSWGSVADVDLAGYRLRWVAGATPDWSRGQPLQEGLVTESPWEMPIVPVGAAVLMVKAVDTSGNESINTANIITDLGQPVVRNVVEATDLQAAGYPGLIGGGAVSGGDLLANSTETIWAPVDTSPIWTAAADPMWDLTYYTAMTYEATITVGAPEAGAQMTIDYAITGLGAALEYRRPAGDASAMWGTETSHTWTDDAAPFRSAAPGWRPWPGALIAEAGDYDIRVRTAYGRTRGTVGTLVVNLDVADLVEYLDDIDIASLGTRLTTANTYRVIRNVNLTLQDDGGSAAIARVTDKSASLGPLINCFTTAGAATTGRVDAIIQGY